MTSPSISNLQPGATITGHSLAEPVEVHAAQPHGDAVRVMGVGRRIGESFNAVLSADQVARLEVLTDRVPFDGHSRLFRLGVEAHRLGLAHEYDPFSALYPVGSDEKRQVDGVLARKKSCGF